MVKKNYLYERLQDKSQTLGRVETTDIEEALGAKADATADAKRGSPFSIWALRSRILTDIVSTGGRPGRRDAGSRKKIPLTATEWRVLDEITKIVRQKGVNASPGQVAGILLNQSMTEVLRRLDRVTPLASSDATSVRALTDSELAETVENILAAAASAETHLEQLRPVALELLRRMRLEKGIDDNDKR